jgi:hypothetical protein
LNDLEYTAVTASFLADDHIELTVVDVAPPNNLDEDSDEKYYRFRANLAAARGLKRAWPKAGIYVVGD